MKDFSLLISFLYKEFKENNDTTVVELIWLYIILSCFFILVWSIVIETFGFLAIVIILLSYVFVRGVYLFIKRKQILLSSDINGIKLMINTVLNDDLNIITHDYNENSFKLLALTTKLMIEKPYLFLFLPIRNTDCFKSTDNLFVSADIYRNRLVGKYYKIKEPYSYTTLGEELLDLYIDIENLDIHKANHLKIALDAWCIQTLNRCIKTNSNVISEVALNSLKEIKYKVYKAKTLEDKVKIDELSNYNHLLEEEEKRFYDYIKSL